MKRAPVLMTALLLRVLLLAIVSLPMLGAASAQQASSTICSGISRTELLNTATNGGAMPFFGGEAAGLAYDPTNNDLYIAENPFPFQNLGSPQVLKIHLADNTKTILAPQGGFGDVSALAFYGGNLYVADGNGYANSFYTQPVPLNVVWQYAPANGTWTKVVTGINDPTGLAFDSSGNMYVSSWTDMNVYEYANNAGTFSSTRLTRWTAPTPSESPYGLAIDQGNNLYIAGFGQSYNTQTKIFKVDPSGNSSIFADPGITEPTALAFDANGYLYASYYDSLKILRIAPDGSYVVYPGGGTVADAANGIALSPQGDLFTVVNGSSTVDGQAAVLQLHGLVPSVNAAAEFSATANPNSAWSYGSTNGSGFTLLSTSTNMPATVSNTSQSASPGLDFWTGSGLGADLFHNGTGAYLSLTCCSALAPGALGLQPGTTGNYATLRWTSPFAGTYQIMGLMTGLDFSGPTNVNGSVTYNGSTSLFSQSVSGFGTPSAVPFLGQATVAACETLDATIAGGSNNLSTGLDVLVLPAPSATPFTFSPLPSPFWFGSQAVGTATNFTVNVTNAGVSSYSLSQSTIVGASNTDFTITSDTCSDTTIAAAIGTCSLTVQFLPMALGARSATLVLNTGAPQLPVATLPVAGVGVANATTIVAANPSPGLYGQPVTLTATVTGPAGLGNPTSGSVNFYDGSSLLGNAALNNGSQSLLPVSSLSIGAHTITAVYVPAAGSAYMGVSGSSLPETIAPGPPTVTFTGAPASAAYNSTFTVTASTNASATATITPAGVCTIAGNLVTMTSGTGTCKLTANWPGDSNYLAASATQTTTATTATSAVALVSSANPVQLGQSVTFTATVTPGTPTGSVTFLDGSTALSTSALAGGSATFMTSALAAGSHSLTASYGGDTNFAASTSAATTISVLPPQVVVITDNETVTVTDAVSFPDVFNAEAVHVADVVFVTPLINVAAPVVDYSAGSLGFSNVPAGQSGTQSLTLSDIGQAPLTVSSAAVSQDSAFSISQIGCSNGATSLPTTLPVGGTCIFLVSYLAPSGAAMNDVLTFTDNAALSNMASLQAGSSYTQSIPLVGSGTSTSAPPAPPAVIPVVDNEAIQVTDTSSFPDVFDSEKITVTDQVIIKIISTTSISPTSGSQGYNVPVTINGTGLAGATAINVSGGGITVSGLTMSDTQVSASFNIAPTATLGARSVTVTTPGGTSNAVTFTVTAPPPTLTSMSPNSGALGYSVPVTLTGTWLASTTGINVSGTGVTASNIIVVNDTTITATFIISPGTASAGTALGPRNVTVTTAGGTSNAVTFTVNAPPPPTLTSIAPASGVLGNSVPVTITGTWLATTTAINISGAGVTVSGLTVVSDTTVTATFNIATTAALGAHSVTVTTPGGTSTITFTVNAPPPPTLSAVSPNSGFLSSSVPVTLTGTNFTTTGTSVTVSGSGVMVTGVTVVNSTTITATINISPTATISARNVIVTTSGGSSKPQTFTVLEAVRITSISPNTGKLGDSVPVTITGSGLTGASAINVSGNGVTISNLAVVNDTTVTAIFTISATAGLGVRNVSVTAPGGTTNNIRFAVVVPPPPTLSVVSPNTGVRGTTVPVTLTGTNFTTTGTSVTVSGNGVTVNGVTVVSSTTITPNFIISSSAALGARNVTVTTPGGTTNPQTFTVQGATLLSVTPNPVTHGTAVLLTLTGTNLLGAMSVTISGAGSTCAVTSATRTTIEAMCTLTAGAKTVQATTPIGTTNAIPLTVN